MTLFNTSKNAFLSSISLVKNDFLAFAVMGLAKGIRNKKQAKRTLINQLSSAIDDLETDDFGVRIVVVKVRD